MNEPIEPGPVQPLPADVESCHRLIGQLRAELSRVCRELAVHAGNQHRALVPREMERLCGKGAILALRSKWLSDDEESAYYWLGRLPKARAA